MTSGTERAETAFSPWLTRYLPIALLVATVVIAAGMFVRSRAQTEREAAVVLGIDDPATRADHLVRLRDPALRADALKTLAIPPESAPTLSVRPGPSPDRLTIVVRGPRPETDVLVANYVARLYVERQKAAAEARQHAAQIPLERAWSAASARRIAAQNAWRRLGTLPATQETTQQLKRAWDGLDGALAEERQTRHLLDDVAKEAQKKLTLVRVVQEADNHTVNRSAPAANVLLFPLTAAVSVGVSIAVMSGFGKFFAPRSRRIDSLDQAKRMLPVPHQINIPSAEEGAAALHTAYDHLLDDLLERGVLEKGQRRTLALTSTQEREGRSSATANLALAAARRGWSVLVVDTDLRGPVQHLLLGTEDHDAMPGLTDLIGGTVASPRDVLRATAVEGVRVLAVGDTPAGDAADLFGSRQMERFVQGIAPKLADLVLFDCPHLLSNEPGRRILPYVNAVLVVVGLGGVTPADARRGLEKLATVEVEVSGLVLVPAGEFAYELSVPMPHAPAPIGLQKPTENTELLAGAPLPAPDSVGPTPVSEPADSVAHPESLAQTEDTAMNHPHAASAAESVSTENDSETTAPEVDDLEAVLQGWRRRDYVTAPAAPTANASAPVTEPASTATHTPPPFPGDQARSLLGESAAPKLEIVSIGDEETDVETRPAGAPTGVPFFSATLAPPPAAPAPVEPLANPIDLLLDRGAVFTEDVPAIEPETVAPLVEAPVISPEPEPVVTAPEPVVAVVPPTPEPEPEAIAPVVEVVTPEPVVAVVAPVVVVAPAVEVPAPVAPPVVAAPPPAPVVAAPVVPVVPVPAPELVAPAPVFAPPVFAAPVAAAPAPAAFVPPAPAVAAAPTVREKPALDMQIDMFPTAPGEMTMRAVSSNAAALGLPHIVLEMTTQMTALRGMRAITPSGNSEPDAPKIALETSTTDATDAARLRLVVGEGVGMVLEAILKPGEPVSIRTGGGVNQPALRLEMNNGKDGSSLVRAVLVGAAKTGDLTLEMRRDLLTEVIGDARWRNRLSLFAAE
jgi:Mrp family chromosome partitioning ATPase